MFRFSRRGFLALASTIPVSLKMTPAQAATTHKVSITYLGFRPNKISIKTGDSIKWSNDDHAGHTATEVNKVWNVGHVDAGRSKTLTFDTPGEYKYRCKYHANMTGKVIVTN